MELRLLQASRLPSSFPRGCTVLAADALAVLWNPRDLDSPPEACHKCHRVLPHCRYCWFNTGSTCSQSPRGKAACSRSWTCCEPCPALGQVPAQHPGAAFPGGNVEPTRLPAPLLVEGDIAAVCSLLRREFPSMLQTTEPLKMPLPQRAEA